MSCQRCEQYDELVDKLEKLLEEFVGSKIPKCPRPPEIFDENSSLSEIGEFKGPFIYSKAGGTSPKYNRRATDEPT